MAVTVCVAGDVMLDVLVQADGPLKADDDTPAAITLSAGGQAANVAAWVSALGGDARLYGPRARNAVGQVIDGQLMARGIDLCAEPQAEDCGVVVSLITPGKRTLASDPGDLTWIHERLADPAWLTGADWLHLSGYLLLRAPDPGLVIRAASAARDVGARVAVDLASAGMIETYGARAFWALVEDLHPTVVFGNEGEWDVVGVSPDASPPGSVAPDAPWPCRAPDARWPGSVAPDARWPGPLASDAVVKRGPLGSTFVRDGVLTSMAVVPGPVVDVTGAGDALAAGYFVGGPQMAMQAAARCISQRGAQPPP